MQSGWNKVNVLFSAQPMLPESLEPASCVARTCVRNRTGEERRETLCDKRDNNCL